MKPSRNSRRIVRILQSIGVTCYDPEIAAIQRLGRLHACSLGDDPPRWELYQPGVFVYVTGYDTVRDVLARGALFTFWSRSNMSFDHYAPEYIDHIDVWAKSLDIVTQTISKAP